MSSQLSEEDQARVERYLSQPSHQVQRKPFRPWLLIGLVMVVLLVFMGISVLIAWREGVI